jgi:hypothetical protein
LCKDVVDRVSDVGSDLINMEAIFTNILETKSFKGVHISTSDSQTYNLHFRPIFYWAIKWPVSRMCCAYFGLYLFVLWPLYSFVDEVIFLV